MQQVALLELCSSRGVTQLKYSNWKKKKKRQKDKIVPSMILHHQDLYCARRCLQDQAVPWLCVGLFTVTGPQSPWMLYWPGGSPPSWQSTFCPQQPAQCSALHCTMYTYWKSTCICECFSHNQGSFKNKMLSAGIKLSKSLLMGGPVELATSVQEI